MQIFKKILFTALLTIAMVTIPVTPIYGASYIAQAATIKISDKAITLEVGKTKTLKITGTSKKVTWSSSKKAVATVSSKGKVVAKTAGTSTITANFAGKKLTCKVTVTEPVNPFLKNAPFDATEIQIENINLVMPSDWDGVLEVGSQNDLYATLSPLDTSLSSSIIIHITLMDEKTPEYNTLKEELSGELTQEYYQQLLVEALDDTELKLSDYKQSDFEVSSVKALKIDYNFTTEEVIIKQANYYFYLNNYFVDVTAADGSGLGLEAIVEYMLSSIILK